MSVSRLVLLCLVATGGLLWAQGVAPVATGESLPKAPTESLPAPQTDSPPKSRTLRWPFLHTGSRNSAPEDSPAAPPALVNPSPVGPPKAEEASPASSVTPAGSEAAQEAPGRADRFGALAQRLGVAKREGFKPLRIAPKFSEVDPGKEVPGAPAANPDYFTVKLKSPFHVIDTGAGAAETEVIELDSGTVGRRHGEGEEWAWLQLDSGLMGLMKKRALRPASQNEVTAYLAAESKSSARLAGAKEPQRSATPQDDHPRESPRAETLTIAAVESAARSFDAPSDAAVPKEQAPRVESPVVAPPVSKTIPLDGGAASGVIAVPSPVPILP